MIPGTIPAPVELDGLQVVGYTDVAGRPAFKLAIQRFGDRWFLFTGHLWHRGWSIVDVTDPTAPRPVGFLPGPANTWTAQVNVADGLLLGGLARIPPRWGGDPDAPHDESVIVVDVGVPERPRPIGRLELGGTGSHRNFWAGGRYAYLATNERGFAHYSLRVVDLGDPSRPTVVGRFWLPGQGPGEARPGDEAGISLHGPAYVVGDRAYLSYGGAGVVILDVSDPTAPRLVSRFSVSPPFKGGLFGAGVHTARPLPRRGLLVANGEAHAERCQEALSFAGILDVADERQPRLVSVLPLPLPPAGAEYRSYCDKGGRFGPHNQHLPQGHPDHEDRDDLVYLTWFNAGLRVYDISDPRAPCEIARFVPPDPVRRYGPLPETALVAQSEDVLVDRRGFIYVSDKNQGVFVLHLIARPGAG
ncbi:MAG TPA: hypothetical protein VNJ28_06485 [Candidatus Limnocylindrales bacterium]|nr:hypothetical protein [Candidatus Limnocylindrales bacterium]